MLNLEKWIWGEIIQIMSSQLPCSAGLKGWREKGFGHGSSSCLCLLIPIIHFLKSRAASTPNTYMAVLGSFQLAFKSPFHASSRSGGSKSTCSGFLCQKMPPCGTSFFWSNPLQPMSKKDSRLSAMPSKPLWKELFWLEATSREAKLTQDASHPSYWSVTPSVTNKWHQLLKAPIHDHCSCPMLQSGFCFKHWNEKSQQDQGCGHIPERVSPCPFPAPY